MDSGALQVANYGGMGMPTVVILGGTDHAILGSPYLGFSTPDTITIGSDIRTFFGQSASVKSISNENNLHIFPNPTNEILNISLDGKINGEIILCLKDLSGREVFSKSFIGQATSIDISEIKTGNYFLEVKSNSTLLTRKISIVH
jgi:hypothetical protein